MLELGIQGGFSPVWRPVFVADRTSKVWFDPILRELRPC